MSFLNAVMSTIGDSQGTKPLVKPATMPPRPATTPSKPNATSAKPSTTSANTTALKRKVDERNGTQALKAPASVTSRSVSPALARSKTSSPAQRAGIAPPPTTSQPYKGTSRPATTGSASTFASRQNSGTAPQKPAATSAAPASTAPKKGYLAILERAKAAQEAAKPAGLITHQKTTEKDRLSRKERERRAAEEAAAKKAELRKTGGVKSAASSRPGSSSAQRAAGVDSKKRKVEVAYRGTMRPVPSASAYSGTMRPTGSASEASRKKPKAQPSYRYAEYSDEEEEEDDMDDYASDVSSDMEAGMDEVEREEMLSAMQARKEDEEALKEENELKKAKLDRKRKLEMLNAAAAKKKKIY